MNAKTSPKAERTTACTFQNITTMPDYCDASKNTAESEWRKREREMQKIIHYENIAGKVNALLGKVKKCE